MRLARWREAGLAMTVGMTACGGKQPQVCNVACVASGATVGQPALSSPVASVSADAPCAVSMTPADGGVAVFVQVNQGGAAGTCQVRETLTDGSELAATYTFAPAGGSGCCSGTTVAVGAPPTFTRSGIPSCPAGQSCVQFMSRGVQQCIESCIDSDAGTGTCPNGTVCLRTSGCCIGTGCAAVSVAVCCPASGC
jgi:hypothetical protein